MLEKESVVRPPRLLRIGRLGPLVLVLWAAGDLGLRLLPPEWFTVNPVLIALRRPATHSSFQPDLSLSHQLIGDAAREANQPPSEAPRPIRFSTDRLGFRLNPYLPGHEPPDVLLLRGFSFVYGGALSDDETLPAVLTRSFGIRAYNGGRWHVDDIDDPLAFNWLLDQLPVIPPKAVLVYLEHENPIRPRFDHSGIVGAAAAAHPSLEAPVAAARAVYRRVKGWRRSVSRWWAFSPLDILTRRVERGLRDGRLLPNVFEDRVHRLPLPDGRTMLIRDYEMEPARAPRGPSQAASTAEYLLWWRELLRERGIDSIVLTLPTRYSVYAPLLERGEARHRAEQSLQYMRRLAVELASRGVPHVDGTEVFLASAREEVQTGRLSFYLEDNHWNPSGVRKIAEVLAPALAVARHESSSRMSPALPAADDGRPAAVTAFPVHGMR